MQRKTTIATALRRRFPEQVVLVVTRDAGGRANVMPVAWTSIVSGDPPMLLLGIDEAAYTYELIRSTGAFVVAYPSEQMGAAVLQAGAVHGRGRDKLAEIGLATTPARRVAAPLLADAVANFECELVDILRPGDCPLVVGRVLAAHVNTDSTVQRLCVVGAGHVLGGVRVLEDTVIRPEAARQRAAGLRRARPAGMLAGKGRTSRHEAH
mgnify:CR=1 FL=1